MFKYKIDVLQSLKNKGYNTYQIRAQKLLNEGTLTDIRNDKVVGIKSLDKICNLLDCQIGDIIEHVKDE